MQGFHVEVTADNVIRVVIWNGSEGHIELDAPEVAEEMAAQLLAAAKVLREQMGGAKLV